MILDLFLKTRGDLYNHNLSSYLMPFHPIFVGFISDWPLFARAYSKYETAYLNVIWEVYISLVVFPIRQVKWKVAPYEQSKIIKSIFWMYVENMHTVIMATIDLQSSSINSLLCALTILLSHCYLITKKSGGIINF